jgi:hypothetical protein
MMWGTRGLRIQEPEQAIQLFGAGVLLSWRLAYEYEKRGDINHQSLLLGE